MSEILDERLYFANTRWISMRPWIAFQQGLPPDIREVYIQPFLTNRYGEPGPAPIGVEI